MSILEGMSISSIMIGVVATVTATGFVKWVAKQWLSKEFFGKQALFLSWLVAIAIWVGIFLVGFVRPQIEVVAASMLVATLLSNVGFKLITLLWKRMSEVERMKRRQDRAFRGYMDEKK